MRHFFSTKVRVLLVLAVLLAVVLAVASNLTGLSVPNILVQGVLTPIRSAGYTLTKQAEQFYSYIFRYEALLAENEQLKEALAQMEDDARTADAMARENDRLRELLELKSVHEDYELVDAYIISRSSVDWESTFTIDRGENAGIEEGMCAITANGQVVGLVSEVGSNYAVIRSILDSALEISATIASSGYNGMVKGGYLTNQAGYLRMNYLPTSAVIRNRDQVVTAGSTVYPKDLIIGYIIDAGYDDTGVAKYAILEPAVDIGSLEQVFILTDYNIG